MGSFQACDLDLCYPDRTRTNDRPIYDCVAGRAVVSCPAPLCMVIGDVSMEPIRALTARWTPPNDGCLHQSTPSGRFHYYTCAHWNRWPTINAVNRGSREVRHEVRSEQSCPAMRAVDRSVFSDVRTSTPRAWSASQPFRDQDAGGWLTSILGKVCSDSRAEVHRGGKPKRSVRPPHQGTGRSSSG